jgi:hypothetical protein
MKVGIYGAGAIGRIGHQLLKVWCRGSVARGLKTLDALTTAPACNWCGAACCQPRQFRPAATRRHWVVQDVVVLAVKDSVITARGFTVSPLLGKHAGRDRTACRGGFSMGCGVSAPVADVR